MKQKLITIKNVIIKYIKDPMLFLSFLIAWMITNGWAYIFIGVGAYLDIKWMSAIGTGYVAFLWLPCTPEKLITVPISVFIYKLFKKRKNNS
jgi:hypothetical protein